MHYMVSYDDGAVRMNGKSMEKRRSKLYGECNAGG